MLGIFVFKSHMVWRRNLPEPPLVLLYLPHSHLFRSGILLEQNMMLKLTFSLELFQLQWPSTNVLVNHTEKIAMEKG